MRILIAVGWLMLPVIACAYHYGPGQEKMNLGRASAALRQAERHAADKEWADAAACYDEALKVLPSGNAAEARRIRLERAKAQMLSRKLADAHGDLKSLLAELEGDTNADVKLVADTRRAMANAQYYNTWLMRLEGEPNDVWEPEIEAARQNYRLLAEHADKSGDKAGAQSCCEDLESAVRLARMSLSELQGLSIPRQCQGCCSCNGSCNGKGKSPGKTGNQAKDVRGAGAGPPPDNSGH